MGCEYLAHEYHKSKDGVQHVKDYCTYTLEACLIDDPMGHLNCTRRTWLMLQDAEPEPTQPARSRRKGVAAEQAKLL